PPGSADPYDVGLIAAFAPKHPSTARGGGREPIYELHGLSFAKIDLQLLFPTWRAELFDLDAHDAWLRASAPPDITYGAQGTAARATLDIPVTGGPPIHADFDRVSFPE